MIASFPSVATAEGLPEPELTSYGAFILDYQTGEEIWSYNGDAPLVPASMTKVMTVYLVYDALRAGTISKASEVPISATAYTLSRDGAYWNIPLHYGVAYTVDEMLYAVICYSACACALALAELLAGDEEAFAVMMNQKAAELGLTAEFYDSYGASAQSMITPRSMAALACALIHDYPDYLNYSAQSTFYFHGGTYDSTNHLLTNSYYDHTGVVDGVKTGTTKAAGDCICVTAVKDDHRIITVTMHSVNSAYRYYDSAVMLDYGFAYIGQRLESGWRYVSPSVFPVYVNGERTEISAYLIDDYSYYRLRDLACALNGTGAEFAVAYDAEDGGVYLYPGKAYTPTGGELSPPGVFQAAALPNEPQTYLNGEAVRMSAYLINGSNYVKLRDAGEILGFLVDWDEAQGCVLITSAAPEEDTPDAPDADGEDGMDADDAAVANEHE